MENNFDKEIKKSLENLDPTGPGDWGRMEEMLNNQVGDSPELEDVQLDGIAYDRLHDLEVPYNPAHWALMEERLADPYALRRRLMKYKVAEVALLLLFIFTLLQYIPGKKADSAIIPLAQIDQESNTNQQTTSDQTSAAQNAIQNFKEGEADTQNSIASTNNNQNFPPSNNSGTASNLLAAASGSALTSKNKDRTPTIVRPNQLINVQQQLSNQSRATALAGLQNMLTPSKGIPSLDKSNTGIDLSKAMLDSEISAYLDKIPPELELLENSNMENCSYCGTFKGPLRVRIGMMIGPDADYVMTPYDNQYQKQAINQYSLGYSGGISFGLKYNRWELETGAIYSAKSYSPRNISELNGSFERGGYTKQGFVSSEIDILRVPLHLRYNFVNRRKWNVYAISGASVNMAVETLFQHSTQNQGESETMTAERSRFLALENQTDSYDGILEGGSLLDNTFLTANVGVGIERYFNNSRMSLFLQPVYQHQFSRGLGPQQDQINSLSILTGARVTLRKKRKR